MYNKEDMKMDIHFLYCIDFPGKSDQVGKPELVKGWLICSNQIVGIHVPDAFADKFSFEYGSPRQDVIERFKEFTDNNQCGFVISAKKDWIDINAAFDLDVEVRTFKGKNKKLKISLDLNASVFHEIEFDYKPKRNNRIGRKVENKLHKALKKQPWITIRMDITNKCNLHCIMCHYKEKEIYSKPAQNITAAQLKHNLKDIGPYVKNIMLSCGFEPLMSKHFTEIVEMLHLDFPHIDIGLCTNAMLLNSKNRKVIFENQVNHVILSFDAVTKNNLERIRAGADYDKIIGNIMALRDLKVKSGRTFPLMFMDFVLMNSNIHEAPAFVGMCAQLGVSLIDFRHLVGNIFFNEHEEMLQSHPEKYNYYRQLIIDESKKYNLEVRLPDAFADSSVTFTETLPRVDLSDFTKVSPDEQTDEVIMTPDAVYADVSEKHFEFLKDCECVRPFNEIMIVEQQKIMPCSFYESAMGYMNDKDTLYSIYFNDKFKKVRRKKMMSQYDFNCVYCPIKMKLLPTEVVK
jgi:MoaA/NifB/PqqE/SkfB family radical SAM enzyme